MIPRFLVVVILGFCCQLICPAQSVWDKSNTTIGKIEKDGIVRDRNNMTIGKFDSDGDVRDRNNMMVGKVKSDGAVVGCYNMTIGYAKDVPVAYAAVFFFFKMFEK